MCKIYHDVVSMFMNHDVESLRLVGFLITNMIIHGAPSAAHALGLGEL